MRLTDYIPEVRERLDASWGYINDFKLKTDRFFQEQPYAIVSEEELQGETKVLRYRFMARREIPAGLRVPISGCLNELRAILDNLVWGLSQVVGERSSCGIDFPVYLTESLTSTTPKRVRTFDIWVRDNQGILSKFPTGAESLIRQLQPFNTYKGNQVGTSHPIYVLNRFVNIDKHKMPLHIAGVQGKAELYVDFLTVKGPYKFLTGQILENNSVIMEFTMPANQSAQGFKPHVSVYIAFDKDSPIPNAPVYEFLVNMHDFIRDEVVTKFEPFFPK